VPIPPLVYLDTNVFIRGVEGDAIDAAPVQELLRHLREFPHASVTSELTLAEVLAPTTRPDALVFKDKEPLYLDLIVSGGFISLCPVSRSILIQTAQLRLSHPQKLPDAIHIATAFEVDCRYFMSHDKGARRLPLGLEHLYPNESGVKRVLESLRA
jgi:predicted nucleic acid-binding protein